MTSWISGGRKLKSLSKNIKSRWLNTEDVLIDEKQSGEQTYLLDGVSWCPGSPHRCPDPWSWSGRSLCCRCCPAVNTGTLPHRRPATTIQLVLPSNWQVSRGHMSSGVFKWIIKCLGADVVWGSVIKTQNCTQIIINPNVISFQELSAFVWKQEVIVAIRKQAGVHKKCPLPSSDSQKAYKYWFPSFPDVCRKR